MRDTMRENFSPKSMEKIPEPLETISNGDSDTNPRMKGIILSTSFTTNLKHHNHVDKTDCHECNMSNQSFSVTEYRTESKNIGFIFSQYYKVHKNGSLNEFLQSVTFLVVFDNRGILNTFTPIAVESKNTRAYQ